MDPFSVKETTVVDFYRHKSTVDEYAQSWAYMNCVVLKDYSNMEKFADQMEPAYIVLDTHNDSIFKGDIITWETISLYIDDLIANGCREDIECLYGFLTDKY
jgi:hypothetical protein